MKKIIALTLAFTSLMSLNAFAKDEVTIIVKGEQIESRGSVIDGRTMIPVRGVFEKLGYDNITWDAETKTATLANDAKGSVVTIVNGESSFTVDGETVTCDVPQQILDGHFVIPLRAVSEAIGAKVSWDGDSKTASITMGLTVVDTLDLSQVN